MSAPALIVRDEVEAQLTPGERQWLDRVLARLYAVLGCPAASEATIVLTDDEEIRELNREWRGVDDATDVLSFAYQEAIDGALVPELLGDVVISLPTARRYAEDAKHAQWIEAAGGAPLAWSFTLELAFLVSHGFLHLLGFDHEEPDDERVMRAAEREVFRSLIQDDEPPRRTTPYAPH